MDISRADSFSAINNPSHRICGGFFMVRKKGRDLSPGSTKRAAL